MRPLDPRLVRYARVTRGFLVWSIAIGTALAGLAVVQAAVLADVITGAFQQGRGLAEMSAALWVLGAVVVSRVVLSFVAERLAHASAAKAKSQLRMALVDRCLRLGPVWLAGRGEGRLANLATRGIDSLDAYFSRYLPMLVLAVIVPVVGTVAILTQDVLAAVIVTLTIPLIPVFMVLIGKYTKTRVERQWRTLEVLSGHFLDVVAGLPTLAIFGRAKAQADTLRRVGNAYRDATLRVLRVSFLSSLALELLATLSVAMIAVSIGLRLVDGTFTLYAGLVVLILAPEVYLPLRMVGANFHAAAEGLGAAEQVFDVLETPLPISGTRTDVPDPAQVPMRLEALAVAYEGRDSDALGPLTATIEPGRVTALVGPSGCGKSTALAVLQGFVSPSAGRILVGSDDLADFDIDRWRDKIAYVPQRPHLLAMSLRDNVRLGAPDASDTDVRAALRDAGAGELETELPEGLDTRLGEGGRALSVGQERRVAVARALLRKAPLTLLDEPTAALDDESEAAVLRALQGQSGRHTIVLVTHRESTASLAHHRIDVAPAPVGGAT